tara:strand:- start:500 stop:1162 length:663 start_codon:yes stop_codon:yes gene_type:complete
VLVKGKDSAQADSSLEPNRIIGLLVGVTVGIIISASALYIMFGFDEEPVWKDPIAVVTALGPYKSKPSEPGGLTVPHQNKCIYNSFSQERSSKCIDAENILAETSVGNGVVNIEKPPLQENDSVSRSAAAYTKSSNVDSYFVQLGAFSKKSVADSFWNDMVVANTDLLAQYEKLIIQVKLRDKGTLYRLRAGPLENKVASEVLCKSLMDRGVGCLVTKKD